MRSFEKKLLGKSEDGTPKNAQDIEAINDGPTFRGIWDDNSSLPEQIESDQ